MYHDDNLLSSVLCTARQGNENLAGKQYINFVNIEGQSVNQFSIQLFW